MSASITNTQGIIALIAAAIGLLSALGCVWLALSLRRLRAAQRGVLGGQGRDLVEHAAQLQSAFDAVREFVEESGQNLEGRLATIEEALSVTITHRSLVRYDAYNELSGRQSMSIALLDATSSGIVLSCIHHRDQVRVYAKEVRMGQSELEFSPEESQALALALSPSQGDGSAS